MVGEEGRKKGREKGREMCHVNTRGGVKGNETRQ
jgi:hypothetical protein